MAIHGKHHNRPKVVTILAVASAFLCMASGSVPLPKTGDIFYLPMPLKRHTDDFWRGHRGIVKIDACEEMKVVAIHKGSGTIYAVVRWDIKKRGADIKKRKAKELEKKLERLRESLSRFLNHRGDAS